VTETSTADEGSGSRLGEREHASDASEDGNDRGKPVGVGDEGGELAVDQVRWAHVMGVGAVAGIGFTVSLFITGLAFSDVAIQADAKFGILAASIIAAIAGTIFLAVAARSPLEVAR